MATKLKDKASIDAIINEMTLEEKLLLLTGETMFFSKSMEKYGIPAACYLDGGTGFNTMQMRLEVAIQALNAVKGLPDSEAQDDVMGTRNIAALQMRQVMQGEGKLSGEQQEYARVNKRLSDDLIPNPDVVGCFPPGMLLGATWDEEAVYACGEALGRESAAFGIDVLLGSPNINLHRDPRNGRLFEGYSEDPHLVSALAPHFVKGVQESGVAANVKHFAANNHETDRMGINEVIPERALRELYLPGFKACIQKGGCKTVMSAYNKINGTACAQNHWLLEEVLRDEWGFDGLVMSDWGAVYERVEGLKNGNDLTMPGPRKISMLVDAVNGGELPMETVDKSVRRYLELTLTLPSMTGKRYKTVDLKHSFDAAYKAAVGGITLLKNDGILPLSGKKGISFFGVRSKKPVASGAGSAEVNTNLATNLYDEARKRLGKNKVCFEEIADNTGVVIVTVGGNGQEGSDRPNMKMELDDAVVLKRAITTAKEHDKPVILVLNTCAPVELIDVIDDVSAILCLYLPGMAGGKAGIDILFGDADPSGRLPLSWPRYYHDTPTAVNFPGENGEIVYGEGLFVGYRYYDEKKTKPLFPFGFGMSYTKFSLSGLKAPKSFDCDKSESVKVSLKVKNTGTRSGSEVVQLYIHDEVSTLRKPFKELKGFKKVYLAPDEEKTVTFILDKCAFSSYDDRLGCWTAEPGDYEIMVGTSSEDIALSVPVKLTADNPYGLSCEISLGKIVSSPEAMRIVRQIVPNADEHIPFRSLAIFTGGTSFKDIWSSYSEHFGTSEEQVGLLAKINETLIDASRQGKI